MVRTGSSMAGFTLKEWGRVGESESETVFCRGRGLVGGAGLPFRRCERVGTNCLQFAHSFNKYLLRNRYGANTRVSDRNTMVNKPWSLTSASLGSSEQRVPKENRKGKAIIIQKDKQDQGRSTWPQN